MPEPIATRAEALARLQAFTPNMGQFYAKGRNHDPGPGLRGASSGLSPWVRRRLVTEEEMVAAALAAHGAHAAGKFIEEVMWRSYFKGWLEHRPTVWRSYQRGLGADLAALADDHDLRKSVERAEAGDTGLECLDAWVAELTGTGHLHNHARMWFASIWIFTLRLPWRLGADFFLRHLLDGDPASNTLGWRWVAGLHTRGKPYVATAANIATFTAGRLTPRPGDLAEVTSGLEATEPQGLPPIQPLRPLHSPKPGLPTALLITEEDCQPETFALDGLEVRGAARLAASTLRSPRPVASAVQRFEAAALADASGRLGLDATELQADVAALVAWAEGLGARQIATPYLPQGPLRDLMDSALPFLSARGIAFCEWRRKWDSRIWPNTTAGFFKVKERIPQLLDGLLPT